MSTREHAAQTARWPAFSLGPAWRVGWLVLSWAVPIALLAWSARLVILEGYLLRAPGGFDGAFNKTITGQLGSTGEAWDGKGLFYGPVFVLEYLWVIAPGRLGLPGVARLDFLLFGVSFLSVWWAVFAAIRPRLLILVLGLWLGHHATVELFANTAHLEALELALMSVALVLAVRGRAVGAGLSLGLAAATKMLPLLFFPYLAIMRKWRMLAVAVAVAGGLFLLTCWVQGVSPWDGALMLLTQKGNLTKPDSTEYEYSITADLIRTFRGATPEPTDEQVRLAIGLHRAIAVLVGVSVGLLVFRTRVVGRTWGVLFGLVAATMLVASPSSHIFYFVFLLPGWTAALATLLSRRSNPLLWLALAASYVMSGFDQPFIAAQRLVGLGGVVTQHWFDWHFPNLALLLALLLFARLLASAGTRVKA